MRIREFSVRERASALIIVLWIGFGLVALSLYFGQSMSHELRAADNGVAAMEAEQAINGAARYVTNVLLRATQPGTIPETNTYRCSEIYVGEATAWFIGRNDRQNHGMYAAWGLVDEGSKLNLNVVTYEMLLYLPRMTPEIAASIIDWRDDNDDVTENGVESDWYLRQNPAYYSKNTNYDTVGELRLVAGMDLDLLFGEDANLNGIVDLNENDSDTSMPFDNRDSRLDAGFMEYFTTYTRVSTNGTNVNIRADLLTLMQERFGSDRGTQLAPQPLPNAQNPGQNGETPPQYGSLLEYVVSSGITREELAQVEALLVCPNATNALLNINTATEAALACIPGIGIELAPQITAYRQSNSSGLNSIAWIMDALGWNAQEHIANVRQVGPWICGRAFQFSADIAAVGRHGRGYKRVKYVFDVADGVAQTKFRQDLTYLGWALGRDVRNSLLLASNRR